jgi:hypothetical protein
MQSVAYKDSSIDRVINGQVPIAVSWNLKHSKRAVLVDSNVFAATKCEIDPLWVPNHLSYPRTSFGIQAEAYAMIVDPLVIPGSEETIRILDECPVALAAPQHYFAYSLLQ